MEQGSLLSKVYKRKRTKYRQKKVLMTEKASKKELKTWKLCRSTGLSFSQLIKEAAYASSGKDFSVKLGYVAYYWHTFKFYDNNFWLILLEWLDEFRYVWQEEWKNVENTDITLPENLQRLQLFSQILGIEPEKLAILLSGAKQLAEMNELLRPLLPVYAESTLARVIMEGKDVKTAKWYLERRLPEIYGATQPDDEPKERIIKIVDQ